MLSRKPALQMPLEPGATLTPGGPATLAGRPAAAFDLVFAQRGRRFRVIAASQPGPDGAYLIVQAGVNGLDFDTTWPVLAAVLDTVAQVNDGPAGPSVAGTWTGTWTNSLGERGNDSLVLEEKAGGVISGTWSGSVPVSGKRLTATTLELSGHTATRAYQMKATLEAGVMTLRYVARRLNAAGSYEGTSTLTRSR
jgi:hypothetical protein